MTALVARLSAVVVAVFVTLGLAVAPPNAPDAAALATVSIADVQLQAAAAATPQANATTPTINDVVEIAALIAATPLWYAALPITLPASITLGIWFSLALEVLRGNYNGVNLGESLVFGVAAFFVGPLVLISSKLSAFLPSSAPPAAAQTLRAAAVPSLQALADVVKAVASAAFSYATLPVTLPGVVVSAAWKELYTSLISGYPNFDIGAAVLRAVTAYLSAPLDAIKQSVSNLFPSSTPVAAQAQSGSITERISRQSAAPEQRSVASSRRAALAAVRTQAASAAVVSDAGSPSAHRAGTDLDADTASTPAKQTATGGSARGVKRSQAD
ncbi:hypothetical protein OG976_17620 [Mycobacterium sp. NBC_00419]|uniref:hypothetical protein n=1 Tax=Mycobacterium sp. NBC_00419 TaxID=2975989 RepID=UPI002E1ECBDA